jgi:hypothetical protein
VTELPAELSEPARWLATELRALKERSGLSLASIQLKTNYSKSSWERWLNGKQLPPRDAVARFAETCGGDVRLLTQLCARAAQSRPPPVAGKPAVADKPIPVPDGEQLHRRHRIALVAAAVIGTVAAGGLTIAALPRTGAEHPPSPSPAPLAVSVRLEGDREGECPGFLIDRPSAKVALPGDVSHTRAWAAGLGGADASPGAVELTIQGLSRQAVVLHAMRVRIAGRDVRRSATQYFPSEGCGGAVTKRAFEVDLDKPSPSAKALPGSDANGKDIPAVTFPYQVSDGDAEVIEVISRTARCDCRWYLEAEWSSLGRSGVLHIDDHGRPFHTVGADGLPSLIYYADEHAWRPAE